MIAWYNEPDPFAAFWLESLISHDLIAPGVVDRRQIQRIRRTIGNPSDLSVYSQCHFFAGIGGWSYALRIAGWPDHVPVWTGSCPCQPFSNTGSKRDINDDRHLWPYFLTFIAKYLPPVVFGEQVASPLGRLWLASVRTDLEALGYRVGAADLCAAGVGAPHIRQRLYWVADRMANSHCVSSNKGSEIESRSHCGVNANERPRLGSSCSTRRVAQSNGTGREKREVHGGIRQKEMGTPARETTLSSCNPVRLDHWSEVEWLPCSDGTRRPTQPSLLPLADGISGDLGHRVGRLRGYGNAIVPQIAAEFIRAYMEVL